MKNTPRYLQEQIAKDLQEKMVFVAGPRQVGKTTLAKQFLVDTNLGYLNWDIALNRQQILTYELPNTRLWIFDEIHKYKDWRNYLKGIYDQYATTRQILVTGSAKLDYYRRGGDSLQGRYHYLRLYPLSAKEIGATSNNDLEELLNFGGFPEPFFKANHIDTKRWSRQYRQRLIEEDLVKLEQVRDLGNLELLMLRLPDLVGSPLSINALREDLQVSHATVANWLDIFVRLYAIFRITPFGAAHLRAVKKEQKHYHYDWTLVENSGARFENMVALHLLKWVHFLQDIEGRELELRYFRDIDGREVDFIVTDKLKPILAIECKSTDTTISAGLKYFQAKFPECKSVQISLNGTKDYISKEGIHVCPALKFLQPLI